jgi:hypothetical protein
MVRGCNFYFRTKIVARLTFLNFAEDQRVQLVEGRKMKVEGG